MISDQDTSTISTAIEELDIGTLSTAIEELDIGTLSTAIEELDIDATDYFTNIAKNPEKDSEFDIKTRSIRSLPGSEIIKILMNNGYDAQYAKKGNCFLGFTAYETKQTDKGIIWEMFRIQIEKPYQKKGYAVKLARNFIKEGIANNIKAIKFGNGGHPCLEPILNRLIHQEKEGIEKKLNYKMIDVKNSYIELK